MHSDTSAKRWTLTVAAFLASIALSSCTAAAGSWEWEPAEDAVPAPEVHYYFDYASSDEFAVGTLTAVVTFEGLSHNVLVEGTAESEPWTYTPATVTVVEPGNSGLQPGDTFVLAIPGGTAEGVTAPSLWRFHKEEIEPTSRYLLSWTPYEYPNFALESVAEFLYEWDDAAEAWVRLQSNPEERTAGGAAVFTVEDEPVSIGGMGADRRVVAAVESLDDES